VPVSAQASMTAVLIDFVRLAFEEEPPSQVAEHVDERVFGGVNEAFGGFGFALVKP